MTLAPSPFAPTTFPDMPAFDGVDSVVLQAGFYKRPRPDLTLIRFPETTRVAGIFTQHAIGSAPVDYCKATIRAQKGRIRALLVNAGCANAFTGQAGDAACLRSAEAAGQAANVDAQAVLLASTGVIGVLLPAEKVEKAIPQLRANLAPIDWQEAARAIMTTDTYPKASSRQARIDGVVVNIAGIAKGSGMIAPNMATFLGFLVTDARLPARVLQTLLRELNPQSFDAVTVDGDRSTNDTLLLFATGTKTHAAIRSASDKALAEFRQALFEVMQSLAFDLVKDGEGAQKFVTIRVQGAQSDRAARQIARVVSESPLVKTAIAGEDANWGRIVMAVGRAGERIDRHRVSIRFGPHWAARDGAISSDYNEALMSAYMKSREIEIDIRVGEGAGSGVIYTCDLTKAYVAINGDYRS